MTLGSELVVSERETMGLCGECEEEKEGEGKIDDKVPCMK